MIEYKPLYRDIIHFFISITTMLTLLDPYCKD